MRRGGGKPRHFYGVPAMRHPYLLTAAVAVFFSWGNSHAEDWSLSTFHAGPRSHSAYEPVRAVPRWRETRQRFHHRRHRYDHVAAPELRYDEPISHYRAEDDRPRGRGVQCADKVRGLGTQWIGTQGALDAAKKDWMERVRYDLGESYLDLTNAKGFVSRCGRVSIGETMGQVMYRCEIVARPCKGEFGTTSAKSQ